MALNIDMNTQFGITASYWRVSQTNVDWTTMRVHIEVTGYASEVTRRAESSPLSSVAIDIDISGLATMPLNINSIMDIGSIVYSLVKTDPRFADATDVLESGQVVIGV